MSLARDAFAVLHTAGAGTDRTLLAWAVGAFRVRHCLDLADYRRTRDPVALGTQGAAGAGAELEYSVTGKGFDALVRASGYRFSVRWRDVAALLDRVVDEPERVAEQRGLLRQRVALTGERDAEFARWQHGDRDRVRADVLRERWFALERRCQDAAACTWHACYPQEQQLSLFA